MTTTTRQVSTRFIDALGRGRQVLLDTHLNCVDRVNAVWQDLRSLTLSDLPPTLRLEWLAVSERANRLALAVAEPHAPSRMDEAGDIGTILLCIERLARRCQSGVPLGTDIRVSLATNCPVATAQD
jgi:hypothetical protein